MTICLLLPSATQILFALGLDEEAGAHAFATRPPPLRSISTAFIVTALALGTVTAVVWADTVRLKSGRTITGHIVKQDSSQVIIAVSGGTEVVAASDVDSISYSDLRLIPPQPTEQTLSQPTEAVAIDTALLDSIRARLLAGHRYIHQTRKVLSFLTKGEWSAAGSQAQRAAQWLLPTTAHGAFSPFNALADLAILLGFRATLVWVVLVLVRERRSFTRITAFLLLSYCLVMLLMVGIGLAFSQGFSAGLWVGIIGIPLLIMALAFLFCWIVALRPGKALAVAVLATTLSVGIETLLV